MGINKNQTGIVSPAGPVSTGPAGFAIVPVMGGGIGPAGAGSGGGGGRQVAGTGGEGPQARPGTPLTGEGDKKSQLRKVKKTLIDLYDLLCYTVYKISRGIVSRII